MCRILHIALCNFNIQDQRFRCGVYEAADCGLLSADLAAGIRRVKGVKKLGVRLAARLSTLASTRSSTTERKARPSIARIAARVRLEAA